MAPPILAPIGCGRLAAKPIETIVDPVRLAGDRIDHAIGRSSRPRIAFGRAEIVHVNTVGALGVAVVTVTDIHIRGQ